MSNKIKKTVSKLNKKEQREGETFVSKEGCVFFIKTYNSNRDVIAKFKDEHGAEVHTTYQNCQNGEIKNPYFRILCGVGYLGLYSDGSKPTTKIKGRNTREYNLWVNMINRCYSGNYPSYENVTVCERWLCFANFLEDLSKIENYEWWLANPNQRIALDKDIKQKGIEHKVYSVETCKFVSASENINEVHERNKEIEEVKEDLVLGIVA